MSPALESWELSQPNDAPENLARKPGSEGEGFVVSESGFENREAVWGTSRRKLFQIIDSFAGFRAAGEDDIESFAVRLEGVGELRHRDQVEDDPAWQQIIPYVVLRHDDRVLLLERLNTQGEKRLHNKLSIGVGGHVNDEPADGAAPMLVRGLRREVREEVALETVPRARLLGFIKDDSNSVGAVHFGVACEIWVDHPVVVRETDRMKGRWVDPSELRSCLGRLESWSRLLVESGLLENSEKPVSEPPQAT